ncbi:MAG: gamma-glutamyl-gamma-aminobutyrate hydrolase family protein [Paraperlucidibaca sp.]
MSIKRAHILQHVVFEGAGFIADWLAAQGAEVTTTAWYESSAELPPLDGMDLLVCMGGPMSVHDTEHYPWLADERAYLLEAITRGVPTLGICLGAQQMSLCLGGEVTQNTVREIGWFNLSGAEAAAAVPAVLNDLCVLHWHGECFSLPAGAKLLASSSACTVQAALLGERALALQCHLEILPAGVEALLAHCADDLAAGPAVQSAETLLHWPKTAYDDMHVALTKLLAWLTRPS